MDGRQVEQGFQLLLEVGPDFADMTWNVLTLHDLDVLERRRAAHWMTRVGETVSEERAIGLRHRNHIIEGVRDNGGGERRVG